MVEWGGRGFGGGPRPRVGRSGIPADDWAAFGMRIGEKMRSAQKDGHCVTRLLRKKCKYWGVKVEVLARLEQVWGKADNEFIERNSSCCLTPEDWYKYCPVSDKY